LNRALHVLHLEDDAGDAEIVRDMLEAEGIVCDITRVQTREDFVASLDKGGLDLILADYTLPSFDGISALKIAAQRAPDVPFIFVSGTLGEEVAIEALKTGATDYLLKERLSGIVPSVRRALREARERVERKRAEEAAGAAKARFEGILDIAQDAIISVDSHQRIILFNQGAEKVFGYGQAEVIGKPLEILLPQRFAHSHRGDIEEFAKTSEVSRSMAQRREVFGRRKDGGEFPAEASISKLCLGNEVVFTVILRDITERKRAQAALRESEEQWKAVFENNPTMYFMVDAAETILSVNAFGAEQLGFGANELIGQPVLKIFYEGDWKRIQRNIESCFQNLGRMMRWEARKIRKDGTMLWVRETANAVLLRKQPTLLVACEDITERKRAEEALHQREKELRDVIETIPAIAWTTAPDGSNVFVSKRWTEYTGLSAENTAGSGWQAAVHPDDIDRHVEKWRASVANGVLFEDEARFRCAADGEHRWFLARAVPMRDGRGNILKWYGILADIEDRKRAEEALRRSEAYLAEAQRLSHTGSFAYDPVRRASLYWSEEVFRICGLDPQRGLPDPDEAARLVHPDDRERTSEVVLKAFQKKAEVTVEYRLLLRDGTVKHLDVTWHPVFDKAGELIEYVGTVADVTERKRAEEERAAHLWFLENMDRVNRAMQGTNDLEQMMSDLLEAVLEIFGGDRAWLVYPCEPEAPSWRPVMEHTRPEFPGAFAMGTDLPIDTEVATVFRSARVAKGAVLFGPGYEHPVPAQVAERFSIRSTMVMAIYPKVDRPYLFGLHQCSRPRQWTGQEKRLFEEIGRRLADSLTSLLMFRSLRESEARLDEAQGIAHVGYWEYDIGAGHVMLSDEACRIHGVEQRDLAHWQERLRELVHPDDRARVMQAFATAVEKGSDFDIECRLLLPNGELRIVHKRAQVTEDESGLPQRLFGMVQDITGLRQAEEELREAQAELARVNRVTTLGVLATSIAHEVNQPLAAVVTSAASGARWLAADPPDLEKARRALDRIAKDGKRASKVITGIRALVNRQPPRKDCVDINEVILEVIAITRREMRRKEISLETSLAEDLPLVKGDGIQLQQVILNLLVNAIEAMSEVVDRPRELVVLSAAREPRGVTIEVHDSGAGLDPKRADHLFEAFYSTKPEGIGVGLAISRSIIEAHGGRLSARPNVPHGAVFQFWLPTDDETP